MGWWGPSWPNYHVSAVQCVCVDSPPLGSPDVAFSQFRSNGARLPHPPAPSVDLSRTALNMSKKRTHAPGLAAYGEVNPFFTAMRGEVPGGGAGSPTCRRTSCCPFAPTHSYPPLYATVRHRHAL